MTVISGHDQRINSAIAALSHQGETDRAFLAQYRQFLLELAKVPALDLGRDSRRYTFYEEAMHIPIDYLKHRDNFDSSGNPAPGQGQTIIEVISRIAQLDDVSRKQEVLKELIGELANPCTSTQDEHGTCAPEAIFNNLLLDNPAEWTRIVSALLMHKKAPTIGGPELKVADDVDEVDISSQRTKIAAYFQSAILATFPPEGCKYQNKTDKYVDLETNKKRPSGMDLFQIRAAREAVFGEPQQICETEDRWIKRPPVGGLYTVIDWTRGSKGQPPSSHALVVLGYDRQTDSVIFRNPHGKTQFRTGDDIFDRGPRRRCYDAEMGVESMSLKDFKACHPRSLLGVSALEAYKSSSDVHAQPAVQPAESKHAGFIGKLLPFPKTVPQVAGLATVTLGAVVFLWQKDNLSNWAWPPVDPAGKSSPLDPHPGLSADVDDHVKNLFSNEEKLFEARQWKAVFSRSVEEEPLPKAVTQQLVAARSAISRDNMRVCDSHNLIFIPAELDIDDLLKLANELNVDFQVGLSLTGLKVREVVDDRVLTSTDRWVLLPSQEQLDPQVRQRFRGLSDASMRYALAEAYPDYRPASFAETVLSTLVEIQRGANPSDFTVLCTDMTGGVPLCVSYNAASRSFTLGTPSDFSLDEVSLALARVTD